MHWDPRREIRRQFESEVEREPYVQRLRQLASEFPSFARFTSWPQVFDHLMDRSIAHVDKDEILRSLVWTSQQEPDACWHSILTLAFWPALESLFRQKQTWDADAETLWSNIYWRFLEVIHGLDVVGRSDKIAGRVFNTTLHNLYEHYCREWDRLQVEVNPGSKEYDSLCARLEGEGAAEIEGKAEAALQIEHLRRLRAKHIISRSEFRLIWAVDVEGQSLGDFASSRNQNREALKKQRQRALARIRRHTVTQGRI